MTKKYYVEYKHIEESVYRDWIEADSEDEAIEMVENGEVDFDNYVSGCGLKFVDVSIVDVEE